MNAHDAPGSASRHRAALAKYRQRAPIYDLELALFEPARRAAIELLALRAGDAVLDVGCGTGLSMPLLHEGVGARGRVVGIEQCPEMMALAQQRVQHEGWRNVTLIESAIEDAEIPRPADAALFHFTHDILREPLALQNVASSLRPGAGVVACGLQWAAPWALPLNLFVLGAALHSVTSMQGLDRPWGLLAQYLDDLRVDSMMGGCIYLVSGSMRQVGQANLPRPDEPPPRRAAAARARPAKPR
jgi:SAM-dependent methyltransferase